MIGFSTNTSLPAIEQVAANFKMCLRRRYDDCGIDDRKKRGRVSGPMTLRNIRQNFSRAGSLSATNKLDRHRLQNAKVIHTPAPESNEKNSFRLLHHYARSAESVIYAQH